MSCDYDAIFWVLLGCTQNITEQDLTDLDPCVPEALVHPTSLTPGYRYQNHLQVSLPVGLGFRPSDGCDNEAVGLIYGQIPGVVCSRGVLELPGRGRVGGFYQRAIASLALDGRVRRVVIVKAVCCGCILRHETESIEEVPTNTFRYGIGRVGFARDDVQQVVLALSAAEGGW